MTDAPHRTRRPGGPIPRPDAFGLRASRMAGALCLVPGCRRIRGVGCYGVCRRHRDAELEAVARFDRTPRS